MKKIKINQSGRAGVKVLSTALLVALVVNFALLPYFEGRVNAGTLTVAKDTISTSKPGATGVDHTITFKTATTGTIASVLIDFCTTSAGACDPSSPTGVPGGLSTTSATLGSVTGLGAGTLTKSTNGRLYYAISSPASVGSNTTITFPFSAVTNPSTADTSSFVRITTFSDTATYPASPSTPIDDVTVAFAVLTTTSIAASATVDSTFTFSVAGVASGGHISGGNTDVTTNVTTLANTIPFGTISAGSGGKKSAAHDLAVTTNSGSGYSITVKGTDPPLADGAKNFDLFPADNTTPAAWTSPAGTTASVNTGYFGYTTNDPTLGTGTAGRFTSGTADGNWAGTNGGDAFTSPFEVAYSATPVNNETTRIGWRSEINTAQPNGDYTGTVTLVATPTF
jgi:hypothetical protein